MTTVTKFYDSSIYYNLRQGLNTVHDSTTFTDSQGDERITVYQHYRRKEANYFFGRSIPSNTFSTFLNSNHSVRRVEEELNILYFISAENE